jgi:hypothetical protein
MKRPKLTEQQRINVEDALYNMWPSVPKENVYPGLVWWNSGSLDSKDNLTPPTCNTLACFGGWCGWWPNFVAQGVTTTFHGAPKINDEVNYQVAGVLFGDTALFKPRQQHPADSQMPYGISDHKMITNRLKWLLGEV